ncbi:hypothetical protein [Micromonospora noduli]|uniref:hypothetical protein n=1 Tax=Micromonospora noduli TaxID=709876 RepID=UPI0011BE5D99|nr:hypothetical protein [Micromonospora noduli]
MSDTDRQRRRRDAEREAERIRILLRRNGGREYDPSREEEHYEGGFQAAATLPVDKMERLLTPAAVRPHRPPARRT